MAFPEPPREIHGVVVEATWRRAGDRLEVEYAVHNRGVEPVWVLDDMLQFGDESYRRDPPLLLVLEDDDEPGLVRLVRGVVHPRATVAEPLVAAARHLEPGGRLDGRAATPLPLMRSHPQEHRVALREPPTRAVLEVGVIAGDLAIGAAPLDDGGEAFVPRPMPALWHQKLLRSAAADLPA